MTAAARPKSAKANLAKDLTTRDYRHLAEFRYLLVRFLAFSRDARTKKKGWRHNSIRRYWRLKDTQTVWMFAESAISLNDWAFVTIARRGLSIGLWQAVISYEQRTSRIGAARYSRLQRSASAC